MASSGAITLVELTEMERQQEFDNDHEQSSESSAAINTTADSEDNDPLIPAAETDFFSNGTEPTTTVDNLAFMI